MPHLLDHGLVSKVGPAESSGLYELTDGDDALAKQQFHALLRPGGRVIQFGYTTTCMPNEFGYHRCSVAVWNTLGRMNDYLRVVDEKPGELEAGGRWF